MKRSVSTSHRARGICAASIATFLAIGAPLINTPVRAATGTWTNDGSSTWGASGNWSGGTIADGAGFSANFTNDIGGNRTVTLDTVRTIGNLTFTDNTHTWTLTGTNILTLSSTGEATPQVDISVTDRTTATISLQLSTTEDVDKEGIAPLFISNTANVITGGWNVNGGTLRVIGTDFTPLGTTIVNVNADGVLAADFDFTEAQWQGVVTTGSAGAIALHNTISSANVTTHQNIHLGAEVDETVTLTSLTLDGADASYNFGGGGGTLVVNTNLADGSGARSLVVRSPSQTQTLLPMLTTVQLGGSNSFTGSTTVGQHTALLYTSAASVGLATGRSITVNNGGIVGGAPGNTLNLQTDLLDKLDTASAGTFAIAENETEALDFTAFGSGSNLRFGAVGTATQSGALTYANGATARFGGGGTLTISSALPTNIAAIEVAIESVNSAAQTSFTRFTGDNSALNVPITVGGPATTTGASSTLLIGAASEIGQGAVTIVESAARVRLLDGAVVGNNVTITSTGGGSKIFGTFGASGTATFNGNLTTNDTGDRETDIDVSTGMTLIFNGLLTGGGDLEKTGAGLLVLNNAANSISQRFDISAGTTRFTYNVPSTFASAIHLRAGTLHLADGITVAETINFDDSTGKTVGLQTTVARSGTVSSNVALNETGTTVEETFSAGSGVLTFTGVISSTTNNTPMSIAGDTPTQGAVVLDNAANTFTHRVNLDSGFLRIGSESNLGGNPASLRADQLLLSGGHLETTATFAIDDTNRGISIDADSVIRVAQGTTLTIQNVITTLAGAGTDDEVIKRGGGTLVLNRANTYVGETQINHGTLRLDFSAAGAPATDILYNGLTLATTNELQLGGSTFEAIGASGAANSQSFFDGQFTVGASEIVLTAGDSGGTMTVSLTAPTSAITRDQGSVVNFVISSGASFNTTAGSASTILANSTGQTYATVGGVDWAAKDSTNTSIVAGSTIAGFYTANTASDLGSSTTNADIGTVDTTLAADETVASIRFNAAEARTITISGSTTELNVGGILVTSAVGANTTTITGTTATSLLRPVNTGNTDFPIIQNNTLGDLIINAVIGVNGGTDALTKAGPGRVVLTQANTYNGQTYLLDGTLSISSNANLGLETTAATLDIDGGILEATATFALDNGTNIRGIDLGDRGGTFKVTGSNTLTVSGVITRDGTDTSVNGLTKTDTGTLLLRGTNIYTGSTTVTAGVLQVGDNTSVSASTGNNSTRNILSVSLNGTLTGTGIIAGAGAATPHTIAGALRPGSTSATAGDGENTLTFNGELSLLAGSITTLTLALATGNAGPGVDVLNLPTSNPSLLTGTITAATHDHVEVSHKLSLTSTGTITLDITDYASPQEGDVFNLLDFGSLAIGTFNTGARFQDGTETGLDLDLPVLGGGLLWDTALFETHGALVVVPEPGALVSLLGGIGMLLGLRRFRRSM